MFNAKQFRELVIRPVLEYLHPHIPYSHEAEDLLFMTAAHESHLGTYLKQVKGPALGVYQMEPATLEDIWLNFLNYRKDLRDFAGLICSPRYEGDPSELVTNLAYATAMARIHYYRVPEALPKRCDYDNTAEYLRRLGVYAKDHYNTHLGAAMAQDYTDAYLRCGGRDV